MKQCRDNTHSESEFPSPAFAEHKQKITYNNNIILCVHNIILVRIEFSTGSYSLTWLYIIVRHFCPEGIRSTRNVNPALMSGHAINHGVGITAWALEDCERQVELSCIVICVDRVYNVQGWLSKLVDSVSWLNIGSSSA